MSGIDFPPKNVKRPEEDPKGFNEGVMHVSNGDMEQGGGGSSEKASNEDVDRILQNEGLEDSPYADLLRDVLNDSSLSVDERAGTVLSNRDKELAIAEKELREKSEKSSEDAALLEAIENMRAMLKPVTFTDILRNKVKTSLVERMRLEKEYAPALGRYALNRVEAPSAIEPARSMPRGGRGMGRVEKTAGKALASASETVPVIDSTGTDPETPVTDQTPREGREALRAALSKGEIFDDAPKPSAAAPERADLQAKETAYLTAFKDFERKQTIFKRLFKDKSMEEDRFKVESLKREYDEARTAYADAITKRVDDSVLSSKEARDESTRLRYEERKRLGTLELTESGQPVSFEIFSQQQDVRKEAQAERVTNYLRARAVVRGVAERRLAALQEALNTRERGAFEKGIEWFARNNQRFEKKVGGKTQARAIRAAATTILIVGGGALVGAAGATGVMALAGYGTYKFARTFGAAALGAIAGKMGGEVYQKYSGDKSQQQGATSLRKAGRGEIGSSNLAAIDAKNMSLARKAAGKVGIFGGSILIEKKAIASGLSAFAVGAGTSATLAGIFSIGRAAEAAALHEAGLQSPLEPSPIAADTKLVGVSAAQTEGVPGVTVQDPTESVPASTNEPEGLATGVTLHEQGAGFNTLFMDLKEAVHANLAGMEESSAVLKHLNETSPTELSREVGALVGNDSMVMHEGDRLFIDEGGKLWFARMDGEPQLLMENGPNGELVTHQLSGFEAPLSAPATEVLPEPQDTVASDAATSRIETPDTVTETSDNAAIADPAQDVSDSAAQGARGVDTTAAGEQPLRPVSGEAASDGARPTSMGSGITPIDRFNADFEARDAALAASDVMVNAHGVEILPAVAAVFETIRPGTDLAYTVVSGGTAEQIAALAEQYANTHPGATVYFETPVRDPLTGTITMRTDVWDSVEGTPATRLTNIVPDPEVSGAQLPSMNTANFTRKLS